MLSLPITTNQPTSPPSIIHHNTPIACCCALPASPLHVPPALDPVKGSLAEMQIAVAPSPTPKAHQHAPTHTAVCCCVFHVWCLLASGRCHQRWTLSRVP